MKVFKLYGKILKKNIGSVIAYVIAFFIISFLFAGNSAAPTTQFTEKKINVAFFNEGEDTALTQGLRNYLTNYVNIKDVKPENVADALYFREIYIAFYIPNNFTEDYLNGKDVHISEETVPEADVEGIATHMALNKFFNLVKVYVNNTDEPLDNIITHVNNDLSLEVSATKTVPENNNIAKANYFYNYLSYLFFGLFMSVVGLVMQRLRKLDIKRRMSISPYPQTKTNLEIILGHFIFAMIITLIMCIISFLYYPTGMNTPQGVWFMINAFCITLPILCVSYFISLLIKSANALPALTNVVSLGSSFLTGAFIPQNMLGKGVLTFAHILPNYYYITNNNKIATLTSFNWNSLKDIIFFMIIQLLFALLFIVLSIVLSKKQGKQEA